jgi:hypothetical protein
MEEIIAKTLETMQKLEPLRGGLFGIFGVTIVIFVRILVSRLQRFESVISHGELKLLAAGLAMFLGVFLGACGILDMSHSTHVGIQAAAMIVAANGKPKERTP